MNNGGFDTLVEFVRETIHISWNGKNLSNIKDLDSIKSLPKAQALLVY